MRRLRIMRSYPMNMATPVLRRVLYGVFASCLAGGAAAVVVVIPSATAASDPCAASEVARTIGSVASSTASYLDAHPDTNNALTAASQQQGPRALGMVKNYFDANPQAGKDLQTLQRPLTDLTGKCKLPITLPQVLQMMQGAQQAGMPSAQSATAPQGSGPLPGPGVPILAPAPSNPTPLAPAATAPTAPSGH
jgi:hemophore